MPKDGTTQQDAIALLKADHRGVEALFAQYEVARTVAVKRNLAEQICLELTVHMKIEEEIFYPACSGLIVKEDAVSESYVEHDGAKLLIAQIEAADPADEFFDAKIKVLAEQISHHVHEEEKRGDGLFAQARAAGIELDEVGQRLLDRKDELMALFETRGLPAPDTKTFSSAGLVGRGILKSIFFG